MKPARQPEQPLQIPQNFRDFQLRKGDALWLSGPDDSHLCAIFERNGMVVLRNNQTGQESFLTPGERYLLGRNQLTPYSINGQHQIEMGAENSLPADFFEQDARRCVSRKHFHIVVDGFDHDGDLGVSIKDVSSYAPAADLDRYAASARILPRPNVEASSAATNFSVDRIPLPVQAPKTLTTPAREIGPKPAQLQLREADQLLLETEGGHQIARLSANDQGLLVSNDLSKQERTLEAGNTYVLDPQTLGPNFFGAASVVISRQQCLIKIAPPDPASGVVSFQLVDPRSQHGTFAKFEIAEFEDKDPNRVIIPKNNTQTFEMQEGQPVTLETLRGSHLFCAYFFNGRVFLHNLSTDETILLKPGEKLPLGRENAQCNQDLLAGAANDLADRHGGIAFESLNHGSATVKVLNGSGRSGLQYALGATRADDAFPYKSTRPLWAGTKHKVSLLGADELICRLGENTEAPTERVFGKIFGTREGEVILESVTGQRTVLQPGRNLIGRTHQKDFFGKQAASISRDHLEANVRIIDRGRFTVALTDLHSSNGTECMLFPGNDLNG